MSKTNSQNGECHQDLGGKAKNRGGDTKFGGPRGNPICKETQFGGSRGNKRGHGFFKKEDTPRFKLEKLFGLSEDELKEVIKDKNSSYAERRLAIFMLQGDWKTYKDMIDEAYGFPKQEIQQTNIEMIPILPKPKKKEK